MPDSEAKKAWIRENTRVYSLKVMRKTEPDILSFLEAQSSPGTVIKKAIREYIANHEKEQS